MSKEVIQYINDNLYGVWYLIGAALVFWMQAGFAMVEAGFTRAKNAGNIIMKNLMDFCIGTFMFFLIGASLLLGNDMGGFIGKLDFSIFSGYGNYNYSTFVFNLVFCATTATIVSGAMAERTKFISYCVYSAVISAIIYPVEAHWTWGGGFLAQMGFHDFAGSNCIHMVGGVCALIGAAMLGPRIGKFSKRTGKPHAIPGHNLTIGALGVFILWLGWYGFNGAAATSIPDLGSIFLTTTVAPAVATVVCMIFTWIKYGAPDVSMCLNASLAGLVGITAGCANVDAVGATIIGLVDGILVVIVVEFIDQKLKIDDPVGAVAVHGCNGLWGTVAVGLFDYNNGVFYGGGFHQLGVQVLGVVCIAAYTAVAMTIVFTILKHTIGLRVSAEEEIMGLDIAEHDLASAYADFLPISATTMGGVTTETIDVTDLRDKKLAPVIGGAKETGGRYTKLTIMCKEDRFAILKDAMSQIGVTGMTVSHVMGCGTQKGKTGQYRGVKIDMNLLPQLQVDIVVSTVPPELVVEAAKKALYTGEYGDGKIFLYDVENVVRIRTNETGIAALDNDVAH